jgi:hypothetical protein
MPEGRSAPRAVELRSKMRDGRSQWLLPMFHGVQLLLQLFIGAEARGMRRPCMTRCCSCGWISSQDIPTTNLVFLFSFVVSQAAPLPASSSASHCYIPSRINGLPMSEATPERSDHPLCRRILFVPAWPPPAGSQLKAPGFAHRSILDFSSRSYHHSHRLWILPMFRPLIVTTHAFTRSLVHARA